MGGGGGVPAITLSQPNYSYGCGCGYCWAVTIDKSAGGLSNRADTSTQCKQTNNSQLKIAAE